MKTIIQSIYIFVVVLSGITTVHAQDSTMMAFANTITTTDLQKHLKMIASEEFSGRLTGTQGQKLAANYIQKHFMLSGLQGPVNKNSKNRYYQPLEIWGTDWDNCFIEVGKKRLSIFKDFYPFESFNVEEGELEVVFAGFGIENEQYSDYEHLDVKGKVVVLLKGGTELLTDRFTRRNDVTDAGKVMLAWEKGAQLVILMHPNERGFRNKALLQEQMLSGPSKLKLKTPQDKLLKAGLLFAPPSSVADILNTTKKKLLHAAKEMHKTGERKAGIFSGKVKVYGTQSKTQINTENVVGFIQGTDKKEEVLILSAHYDHVGIKQGKVYYGADDNGSGTSALLEMTQAFSEAVKAGYRPRRSILFIAFSGEELGLYGSKYYISDPLFPLKNTVANLNADMLGRVDPIHTRSRNYIYTIGSDFKSERLHQLHESVAKTYFPKLEIDYAYSHIKHPDRFYYRSDHYNFGKLGIPIIFYFDGKHADYHKPTDTADKIDYELLALRTKLVFCTAWQIANQEDEL